MKKMIGLVLLLVLSFVMFGCKEDKSDVDDEIAKIELISTQEFTVDEIGSYEYTYGERVYIYKHIVDYTDEKIPQPIYAYVASKDVYEVGDTFTVATVKFTKGESDFDYNVIQFEDLQLDTSWHKYSMINKI